MIAWPVPFASMLAGKPFRPLPLEMLVDTLLNRVFAASLDEGELDFLAGREVLLAHASLPIGLRIQLLGAPDDDGNSRPARRRLRASPYPGSLADLTGAPRADLLIRAELSGFLHMIARDRDADTLFFQRLLSMEGDTDLGLRVKNLLDGLDVDELRFGPQLQRTCAALLRVLDPVAGAIRP
ncbi:MAG: SCP2 sterol-binding domain-containing protein [Rhodocyclaceae bacterium]|nr:SCP2 sterol-binding domain-containing protein [Gammaproteobacteria bacterium]MCB1886351.1 SCP2 sterol-binding domain-containing protein [Rhodocyclaceae bacterium]MCP5135356.1 SCP2 sterol-binding domain-containing protein [Gammaproteobacteria bacterium]